MPITDPRNLLRRLLEYIGEQAKDIDPRGFRLGGVKGFVRRPDGIAGLPGIETDLKVAGDHVWLRVPRLIATKPRAVSESFQGLMSGPQVETGAYRIDMVVEGGDDTRLAIECDGDEFHGPDRRQHDMHRQRVLERAGWVFWRCFASTWALRKDELLEELLDRLKAMGVMPLGSIDRAPSLVEKRVWTRKERHIGSAETEIALEAAISAAKSS